MAIYAYLVLRVLGTLLMSYDKNAYPLDGLSIYTPFKMAAWMLTLDYFFCRSRFRLVVLEVLTSTCPDAYHRSCHEVPALWYIHKAHHMTRHPTPLLSIL